MWEFNNYILGREDAQKKEIANAILIGYYSAYYTNGGKKAKNPNELINRIFAKKQSFDEGLKQIELAKEIENKMKNKEVENESD